MSFDIFHKSDNKYFDMDTLIYLKIKILCIFVQNSENIHPDKIETSQHNN